MSLHHPIPTTSPSHAAPALLAVMPRIQARARAMCRCPALAEDLAQDCLAKLWSAMQRGDKIDNLEAYAMLTLRHLNISRWRRTPQHEPLEDDTAQTQPTALPRLVLRDVQAAIAQLPQEQRAVLNEVLSGETSPAAIARRLGVPKGTVMSRLARARAALRRDLPDEADL